MEIIQTIEVLLSTAGFAAIVKLIITFIQNKYSLKKSDKDNDNKIKKKNNDSNLEFKADLWKELKETQDQLEKFRSDTIDDLSKRLEGLEDRLAKCNQDLLDCKEQMLEELQKIKLGKLDE